MRLRKEGRRGGRKEGAQPLIKTQHGGGVGGGGRVINKLEREEMQRREQVMEVRDENRGKIHKFQQTALRFLA